jgi:hypothetical protein
MDANGGNGVFPSLPELVVPDRHIIAADFDDEHLRTAAVQLDLVTDIQGQFQRIMEAFRWGNQDQIVGPTRSAVWTHDWGAERLIAASLPRRCTPSSSLLRWHRRRDALCHLSTPAGSGAL